MPLKTTRVDGLENVANGETPFDLCCVRMKGVKRFAQLEYRVSFSATWELHETGTFRYTG